MEKADQTAIAGIGIGIFLTVGTLVWPWPIPDEIRHILFWTSALFVLAGCLWLLDLHFLNKKRNIVRRGIPILSIIMFSTLIAEVEWPKNSSAVGNPLDNQISIDCEPDPGPDSQRENERTEIFEINDPSPSTASGPAFLWAGNLPVGYSRLPFGTIAKCTFENYSSVAVESIEVTLEIEYHKPIQTNPNLVPGTMVSVDYEKISPLSLGPVQSPNNADYFYVQNVSKDFVYMSVPNSAGVRIPGSADTQVIKLTWPERPLSTIILNPSS